METAIVLFTRDLRVRDNPALALACARARQVVPLFVVDPALTVPPNRARFLAESIAVLRGEVRKRGGDLMIRYGEPVSEVIRLARQTSGQAVFMAGDVSRYAARRQEGLERERAWRAAAWRQPGLAPPAIHVPREVTPGDPPMMDAHFSHCLAPGGERAGRELLRAWLDGPLSGYGDGRDDLADPRASRLSAYLRFGCISPIELARAALPRPGGEEFSRQLAWRDFFHQVTAAFPDIARTDYRSAPGSAPRSWSTDEGALDAWRAGQTGIPIVDAAMHQLATEGFMHNRARMITASFLTRTLGIDWRHGYRHFRELLADGDVACNAGNWQWVAGTGNNLRPGRVLNPLRQAARFDRDGDYVRRYLPELASLPAPFIHTPWKLPAAHRRQLSYPPPLVSLAPEPSRR